MQRAHERYELFKKRTALHFFLIKRLPREAGTKGFHGSASFGILGTGTGCENKAECGQAVEDEKVYLGITDD